MAEANGFRYFDGFRCFESDLAGQLVLKCLDHREGVLEVSYIVHCRKADPAIAVHPHQEAGGRGVALAVAALARRRRPLYQVALILFVRRQPVSETALKSAYRALFDEFEKWLGRAATGAPVPPRPRAYRTGVRSRKDATMRS